MNKRSHTHAFTLIEVLIALVLVSVVLGSIILNNVRLAEINSRAEVQALEAGAAEAVAQLYVNDLPAPGETRSGSVSSVLPLTDLSENDKAIWNLLDYRITRQSRITITITRHDLQPDPNPLIIEVDP